MGGDESLSMINLLLTFNMVMAMKVYGYLIVGIVVQMVLIFINKRDPFMKDIYMRYIKLGNRYDPWMRKKYHRNRRFSEFSEY